MANEFETELRTIFLAEASQLLEDTERCFLSLEATPQDGALIEQIFRLAHNLKGSAKAVGFANLGDFTHHFESYLLRIKSGELAVSPQVVNLLLRCNDHIAAKVERLKSDADSSLDHTQLLAELSGSGGPVPAAEAASSDAELPAQDGEIWATDAAPLPPAPISPPLSTRETEAVSAPGSTPRSDESIRVSVERIDRLLNFVGEMVILQTVLKEQAALAESALLRKTVHQMGKVTKEVQDLSMSLRMVPLRSTFQKMQRIVRDTSMTLAKTVHLDTVGEEAELDKTVLEKLSDPLVHLIRNAVDHGIESPEERLGLGKPAHGTVHLRAYHQGGKLVIEVEDDGGGLDAARLRAKGVEKKLIAADAVASDQQAYQLIFRPGFSTKTETTDVSGRGVGMDVVRTNVEQLQGEISLTTAVGKGTCFRIHLPLTLAIIDGMSVLAGQERYVLPLSHVHESMCPAEADVHFVSGMGDVYCLRGENLPLYRLTELLGRGGKGQRARGDSIAIVVRALGQPFAVLVDDIIGQHQVVIKQLGREFQGLRGFSGSAIMGDGRAALILELQELVARHKGAAVPPTTRRSAA